MIDIFNNSLYIHFKYWFFFWKFEAHAKIKYIKYSYIFFVISVSLFFAAVFLGLLSIACRTSRRARLCEVWSASIHFGDILMLEVENAKAERAESGEESDNLFSRVSRRCCSYAASFFVYHVRIGGFLPSSPTVGSNRISPDEVR